MGRVNIPPLLSRWYSGGMSGILLCIDTLYEQIVRLMMRVVSAYIYADSSSQIVSTEVLPPPPAPLYLPVASLPAIEDEVVPAQSEAAAKVPLTRGMVMYAGMPSAPLFRNPTVEFDGQIAQVPFGAMVMAGEPKGRFYPVTWKQIHGWMLQEDLADRAVRIYPAFTVGQENLVDAPNTAQVRALIGDVFGLARSEFALQAGEYVLYRLWRKGSTIAWPQVRPRVPGMWHEILRGAPRIHMSLTPAVGTVMEYVLEGDMGHVAYVDAVFPDETVSISEVNNPDSGIYNERQLSKETWKELKPIFIGVVE